MLLSVAAASTASAQDPCRSLDPLLQSVGIIHEIEIESSRRAQLTSLQKLNGTLDDISILDLYSDLSADEMDVHQSALIIFIGELNVAMEHAYSNEHDFALQTLRGGVPRLAREEITRLQAELSCNVSASDFGVTEKGFSALPVRSTGQPVQLNHARARSASRWMRPGNAGISYRAAVGSDTDRSETLKKLSRYWPYIFIVVVFLTGLAIWFRRRVKRWKHRAERRICHQAVSVRLGRQVRQLTIVDFNVSGFRLKHDGLIKRRRPISLKFDEGWHEGQIVWLNDNYAGVHLAKPLTDHEVERVWAAPVSA